MARNKAEAPALPPTLVTPETPAEPVAPEAPVLPVAPETPAEPEAPEAPVLPVAPETPAEPEAELTGEGPYRVRHKVSGEEFEVSKEYLETYRSTLEIL